MKKFLAAAAAVFLIFGACSAAEISGNGFVEVEYMAYPEKGESPNATQRVAEVMARRALVEQIGELYINSSTKIQQYFDGREVNDAVVAKVEKVLQGSQVVTARQSDGSFRAVARLPIFGSDSLVNEILPEDIKPVEFLKPKFTNIESEITQNYEGGIAQDYTGLIVDCSGQELSTAVLPTIKMLDGTEIYSFRNVKRQFVVNRGLAGYSDSAENGVERVGNNPLVVKAVFVENCDAVVSDDDANKILAANQRSKFLNKCLVIFVR